MKLSGWIWLIVGIIITGVSGYIYKYVPTENGPNNSMALFFFIGSIFIIVGILKLFFKRIDNKAKISEEKMLKKEMTQTPVMNINDPLPQKRNRIEEDIARLSQSTNGNNNLSNNTQSNNHHAMHHQGQQVHEQTQNPAHMNAAHQNTYAKTHEYKGPVFTGNTTTQQLDSATTTKQTSSAHVQTKIFSCPKCGTPNHNHSNYCHICGGRLK